ncbi:unnamed protein product [Ectocarpus sp. 12 AP-2014]
MASYAPIKKINNDDDDDRYCNSDDTPRSHQDHHSGPKQLLRRGGGSGGSTTLPNHRPSRSLTKASWKRKPVNQRKPVNSVGPVRTFSLPYVEKQRKQQSPLGFQMPRAALERRTSNATHTTRSRQYCRKKMSNTTPPADKRERATAGGNGDLFLYTGRERAESLAVP